MSKSGRSTRQSQYEINETELVKFVKHHPLLHDPNAEANDGMVEALWEEIAEKLCAPGEDFSFVQSLIPSCSTKNS